MDANEFWCDYCQRGKQGYKELPRDIGVTDRGGELVCDSCNRETVTAMGEYKFENDSIWEYFEGEPPEKTITIHGEPRECVTVYEFDDAVSIPVATERVEEINENETVTFLTP